MKGNPINGTEASLCPVQIGASGYPSSSISTSTTTIALTTTKVLTLQTSMALPKVGSSASAASARRARSPRE